MKQRITKNWLLDRLNKPNTQSVQHWIPRLLLGVLFVTLAYCFHHEIPKILSWLQGLHHYVVPLFIILYCLMSIFCLPNVLLVLLGGALFGIVEGTFLNLLGATLGALCGFCLSRYIFPHHYSAYHSEHPNRFYRFIAKVEQQGWKSVALLRLLPLVPYNLVNYALGMTKIKLSHFLLATAIFLIPNKLILTYCGYKGVQLYQVMHR